MVDLTKCFQYDKFDFDLNKIKPTNNGPYGFFERSTYIPFTESINIGPLYILNGLTNPLAKEIHNQLPQYFSDGFKEMGSCSRGAVHFSRIYDIDKAIVSKDIALKQRTSKKYLSGKNHFYSTANQIKKHRKKVSGILMDCTVSLYDKLTKNDNKVISWETPKKLPELNEPHNRFIANRTPGDMYANVLFAIISDQTIDEIDVSKHRLNAMSLNPIIEIYNPTHERVHFGIDTLKKIQEMSEKNSEKLRQSAQLTLNLDELLTYDTKDTELFAPVNATLIDKIDEINQEISVPEELQEKEVIDLITV